MIRFALLLLFCWSLSTTAQAQRNIRVGIVAYEDFESELTHYQQFFSDLTKRDPSVTFDLAVGSYSEVLHWTERQLVDLAILTPGVFASIMPDDSAPSICRYVASVELPPAQSPLSPEIRQSGKQFFGSYRSVCVVAKGSSIRDADDLRRAAASDAIEFLFVHPNSLSGYIGPLRALRQLDIEPQESQLQFTYSHTQSLRRLEQETSSEKTHVAFVWDDVEADADLISGLRRIEFPELDALELPRNVIVASSGFDFDERLRQLIVGSESDRYRFSALSDWREKFRNVRSWLEEADALALGPEKLSLDEVAQSLLQYARSQPQPPRLALVLSGGGAKCSYQVGAVAALEERLEKLRRESGDESLDIQLVVGTSGGAINSVPVAMGISKTQAGRDGFATTWRSLDQRDIVRLPRLMRINMGVWFAALQTAIVIWLVRRYVPDLKRRGEAFAATYT
ncbi:MAG: PhnD/SsuA/transferrin family substrate-binding protein, partial [Planctomycetota bacterium]